jgi:hypothetical protein
MCKREFLGAIVVCSQDGTLLMRVTQDPHLGTVLQDKYRVR